MHDGRAGHDEDAAEARGAAVEGAASSVDAFGEDDDVVGSGESFVDEVLPGEELHAGGER